MESLAYILSPSFSGSTLLTLLLSTHPSIATIGELKATPLGEVSDYQCSCGSPILECFFWKEVAECMKIKGHMFSPEKFDTTFKGNSWFSERVISSSLQGPALEALRHKAIRAIPSVRARYQSLISRNLAMMESICEISGGRMFLDGSKDAVRLSYLAKSISAKLRTIFLIRDGRGQTCSYMRHYGVAMSVAVDEWLHTQRECRRVMKTIPSSQFLRVQYEELCRDPMTIMGSIYRFLGLDPDLGSLTYIAQQHHILGNSMRLRKITDLHLDERWHKEVSSEDLAYFERRAGSVNRALGYSD